MPRSCCSSDVKAAFTPYGFALLVVKEATVGQDVITEDRGDPLSRRAR
jgi:hypothetical protein